MAIYRKMGGVIERWVANYREMGGIIERWLANHREIGGENGSAPACCGSSLGSNPDISQNTK